MTAITLKRSLEVVGTLILGAVCPAVFAQGMEEIAVQRGLYLARAGDCVSCHTAENGKPFAGGFPVPTPFGTIYSTNITPDTDTGIGKWSDKDFYRAMHEGIRRDGKRLYPAFPYPWFTKMTKEDVIAIKRYLDTLEPVRQEDRPNELPWPLSVRLAMRGWNQLFFEPGEYQPRKDKSEEWNRGAYLVNGAGHCAACHTPKNVFGAVKEGQHLLGGDAGESWFAPSLGSNQRDGIGSWEVQDIVDYLKTGNNHQSSSAGSMTDVVMNSTQYMSDNDLEAIAVYLKDLPSETGKSKGARQDKGKSVDVPDDGIMRRGEAIYVDNCMACHMADGAGQENTFPPLRDSSATHAEKADTLIQVTLAGQKSADPETRPTGLEMPPFAWKLSDEEVANVITYVRNAWGNEASPVSAGDVSKVRKDVMAQGSPHPGPLASPY